MGTIDMRELVLLLLCAGAAIGATQGRTGPTAQKPASPTGGSRSASARPPAPPPAPAPLPAGESWLVWGGPRHDFTVQAAGLASSWPATGPVRVWTRALGDGYSAIAEEHGMLYTAFRRGANDVTVALDARTGTTVWEFSTPAEFRNGYAEAVGPGPYAMPQVVGDRLFVAGGTGRVDALDKRSGRALWSRDLYAEFRGTRLPYGYSSHGLPYKDTIIFLAGGDAPYFGLGRGSAVVALRQSDGGVVWKNLAFTNAHSSPLLITVDGQPQVVALVADRVIGFNPDTGELLWSHAHPTQNGLAISTPVWSAGNLLFVSSAYSGGARVLRLTASGGKTTVTELWHNPRIQLHFGSAIVKDGYAYVSSGHTGPAFMSAVELKSGRIAWQTRDFAKAQLLSVEGKLVILDEDGTIALGRATPTAFEVLTRAPLQTRFSWTPPTIVGTRLYLRDRATISALDLGVPPPPSAPVRKR